MWRVEEMMWLLFDDAVPLEEVMAWRVKSVEWDPGSDA